MPTSDGATGVGEAFGNPFVTREYFNMIEPFFIGKSVFDFEHIEARIRNAMYHLGVGNQLTSCLAAINVALFDAIARGFGVRVCDLIGGCARTRIPAYASTGFFSDDPNRQLGHMLKEAADHPYAGAKIKIGRGIANDVERVRQARAALGKDKLLLVDINGAYTPDLALECARAIEPFGIHWIEEPLPPGDLRGYAELRARSPIPLAAGEAHHTIRDFKALIDRRCIDIVQPSIPGVGGLTEAMRVGAIAARGRMGADGALVDCYTYVFRHEPSVDPARMQMFRQREHVRLGSARQALDFRTLWMKRGKEIIGSFGLPFEVDVANDPFFGRTGKLLAASQREESLKFELLVPITSKEQPTACVSFNYHRDLFGQNFGVETASGEPAHTACVGFGVERIALALFRHHGFDPKAWPAAVRNVLGL